MNDGVFDTLWRFRHSPIEELWVLLYTLGTVHAIVLFCKFLVWIDPRNKETTEEEIKWKWVCHERRRPRQEDMK